MEGCGLKREGQYWEQKNCPKLQHMHADDLRGGKEMTVQEIGKLCVTHVHITTATKATNTVLCYVTSHK